MTLIKSISGIRGIIGDGLTPDEIVKFTVAFHRFLSEKQKRARLKVVIGRDARTTGEMLGQLVSGTLMACGTDVTDLGLATTPTVELAVTSTGADGGIILTASHNPAQWNALKLLNEKGEFISAADGEILLRYADRKDFRFPSHENTGRYTFDHGQLDEHIRKIINLPLVDIQAIRNRNFKVAFDAVNSVGGMAIPKLLTALGVRKILPLNDSPDGIFPHNPEPLPEHLGEISALVAESKADLGFVVDPDVDRLAIVSEDGSFFGEEYTLVAVADYILRHTPGNTVSNLSSTRALKDITEMHGGHYFASAVGEVNVVEMMKQWNAVIGGEGNGGVIYPELHYGRDALVGIALFLSHLAKSGLTCSILRKSYPDYYISKNKMALRPGTDIRDILAGVKQKFSDLPVNETDGVKIEFEQGWVHLRSSNTEPIVRIYAEGRTAEQAQHYADLVMQQISSQAC
jgi:phosphomannomutase